MKFIVQRRRVVDKSENGVWGWLCLACLACLASGGQPAGLNVEETLLLLFLLDSRPGCPPGECSLIWDLD